VVHATEHRSPPCTPPSERRLRRRFGASWLGTVSAAAGAAGVVVGILPLVGVSALLLAAVAIGTGVPAMRSGPEGVGFHRGRTGVVLGMIAVVVGLASLAAELA